jgi:hypothetical protein
MRNLLDFPLLTISGPSPFKQGHSPLLEAHGEASLATKFLSFLRT